MFIDNVLYGASVLGRGVGEGSLIRGNGVTGSAGGAIVFFSGIAVGADVDTLSIGLGNPQP